ncbi:MAG: hypothetical protein AAF560_04630 [Acidobacteriota bacterium]
MRRMISSLSTAVLCLLLYACALEPPISVGQRESTVGQGIVISLTNTSDKHLHEVVVDIVSPEGEAKQLVIPTLNPHESFNVGWLKLDGWPIPKGSSVKVSAKDFAMSVGPQKL